MLMGAREIKGRGRERGMGIMKLQSETVDILFAFSENIVCNQRARKSYSNMNKTTFCKNSKFLHFAVFKFSMDLALLKQNVVTDCLK